MIYGQDIVSLAKWYQEVVGFDKPEGSADEHLGVMAGDTYFGFDKVAANLPTGSIELYFAVENCDTAFAAAKATGAKVDAEPRDASYGGRECAFIDPVGNRVFLFHMREQH